ncbi:YeeE/YedE family protein [Psychrobacter pacificensis]|uniref:YeeE/YedE family protein n=1 Tax=Psychrobacter pacificensis TaxID=112002 RepID=UPI001CBD4069|nr:YeeE/YedE family protein [Psychrobacter pacificensis]MBZ1393175.1 YeeE/YedE family protein [Psychrobacter pacificensis]MDE0842954.1 YeeE/YedE family protein [Psychrobacter pacificensis]
MSIQIDWQAFTPISLVGGLMLGVATVILLLGIGRIAGISGIFSSLLKPKRVEMWQILFILGLVISPVLYRLARPLPNVEISTSLPLLIVAGLLVGFGTRLGSGCTSGHGICGNARLSPRSLVATVTFMLLGIVTVYIGRHVLGLL